MSRSHSTIVSPAIAAIAVMSAAVPFVVVIDACIRSGWRESNPHN